MNVPQLLWQLWWKSSLCIILTEYMGSVRNKKMDCGIEFLPCWWLIEFDIDSSNKTFLFTGILQKCIVITTTHLKDIFPVK